MAALAALILPGQCMRVCLLQGESVCVGAGWAEFAVWCLPCCNGYGGHVSLPPA